MMPIVSVVIPVYNDLRTMVQTLDEVRAAVSALPWRSAEILVVDDGSRDATVEIVTHYIRERQAAEVRVLKNGVNRGKGFSVAHGMLKAQGAYRIFMDSDLSTPLRFMAPFIEALEKGADIVVASRFEKGAHREVQRSAWLNFLGWCERMLIKLISGLRMSDTQCGFKAFRAGAAEKIFDVEALFLAKKMGYQVVNLPVDWHHDADTRVRWKDPLIFVWDLLRIRWFWLRNHF